MTYYPFPGYEEEINGSVTMRRTTYHIAGQSVAVRRQVVGGNNNVLHLHNDHLGSNSVMTYSSTGGEVGGSRARYLPYGGWRTAPTQPFTERGYTGHLQNAYIKLIDMRARWYDPAIGRFISPDTIVPDPANPQSFNRYSYSYNNPVNYSDPSGHCVFGVDTAVCIAIGAGILKAVDYGWTAYDVWQAGRTLNNPAASGNDRMMAGLTVGLSIVFEVIEPDDLLPLGLPTDDIARRALLNGAEEALEDGGPQALEGFLRNQLGDQADAAIRKMDELLGLDPDSLFAAAQAPSGKQNFTAAGHALQKHANRAGDIWAQYLPDGTLNPANYNARASELVMGVLTDPGTMRRYWTNEFGQNFIEYFAPDARGLRYLLDGTFVTFINP